MEHGVHCETMDTMLAHHVMCLSTTQLAKILIVPTHRWMARLSLLAWLHTEIVYSPAHPSILSRPSIQ